MINPIKPTKAC